MLATDVKLRKCEADTLVASTNGGRITGTTVSSNVIGATWPIVTPEQLTNGDETWRKRFLQIADDDDGTMLDFRVWLDIETPGDDYITMCLGTDTNFQSALTGSENHVGTAPLKTAITAGGSTIVVTVPNAELKGNGAYDIFRVGEMVRLTKQSTPSTTETTAEFLTIAAGGITENGNDITIVVEEAIANDYALVDNPRLCSVLELGTVVPSFTEISYTGGANYDSVTYAPVLDNIGTFTQRLTFTFTDSSSFTVSGNSMGALPSGNKTTNYSPTNSQTGKPLLTLLASGWDGLTISAGNTFVLDIFGAQKAIWRRRKTPAGATYVASNYTVLAWYGAAA